MENPKKKWMITGGWRIPPIYGNPHIVTLTIQTLFCLINVSARFSLAEFTQFPSLDGVKRQFRLMLCRESNMASGWVDFLQIHFPHFENSKLVKSHWKLMGFRVAKPFRTFLGATGSLHFRGVCHHIGVSHKWWVPKILGSCHWKSEIKRDENWGHPHFRKPPYITINPTVNLR